MAIREKIEDVLIVGGVVFVLVGGVWIAYGLYKSLECLKKAVQSDSPVENSVRCIWKSFVLPRARSFASILFDWIGFSVGAGGSGGGTTGTGEKEKEGGIQPIKVKRKFKVNLGEGESGVIYVFPDGRELPESKAIRSQKGKVFDPQTMRPLVWDE